jgi:hypothetical protein
MPQSEFTTAKCQLRGLHCAVARCITLIWISVIGGHGIEIDILFYFISSVSYYLQK